MIRIRVSDAAWDDLNNGFDFYEAQQRGLGAYFAECLRKDIQGLEVTAGSHRLVYRDFHRVLSRVFPFGIYYTKQAAEVVVWAVLDLRRDPTWIRRRLAR